ncbi:MAG TPA: HAD-IIA family hydrolase [Firmicutes bacterium]|nr:HAD-IIA family hydrolase [Bacillota bacterium]
MSDDKAKAGQALLIDLDGVIYHGARLIPGADRFLAVLTGRGIPFVFLTNNSAESPESCLFKLQVNGINIDGSSYINPHTFITAAQVTVDYLCREYPGCRVLALGEPPLLKLCRAAGITLAKENPDCVVVGECRQLSYETLCRAANAIAGGAAFLATNGDITIPVESGFILGCGAICRTLEAATGVKPLYLGKPNPICAAYAASRLNREVGQLVIIGDNRATDIALARNIGVPSILISAREEGRQEEVDRHGGEPTLVVKSVADLVENEAFWQLLGSAGPV